MAIHFIVGKPGGGKSMYGTKLIIEELVYTSKVIRTNIPLKLPELNEYLQRKYPAASVDLHERVRLLTDEEVFEFYRYRAGGLVLPSSPDVVDKGAKKLDKLEFIQAMKERFGQLLENPEYRTPCVFFIDEAHNYFNAREWMTVGRGLLYYTSQHRHLHDEIYFLTQALGNVEKQLKSVAQDYYVLRNMYKETFGPFRQSGCFRRRMYYSEPNGAAQHADETRFKIDVKGVCACYETCGALGIGHESPEQERQPRKLPWWTLWAGTGVVVVLIAAAIFATPKLIGVGIKKALTRGGDRVAVSVVDRAAPAESHQSAAVDSAGPGGVWLVGRTRLGEQWWLALSDGRTVKTGSGRVGAITRNYAVIDGERYEWREPR